MSTRTQPPRSYREEEVQQILKKAAGYDRDAKLQGPALSLEEIESVAREAGIDPQAVRRAALELEHVPREKESGALLGAPTVIVLERVVPGPLSERGHEKVLEQLTVAYGLGAGQSVGRAFTWRGMSGAALISVTVSPRGDDTVIRIEGNFKGLAGGLYGGIGGGVGGGVAPNIIWMMSFYGHVGLPLSIAAGGLFFGAVWLGIRRLFSAKVREHEERLTRLADALVATLAS